MPDPRFPDFAVPVAVRGTISFKIADYREFIRLHRLAEFRLDDFQKQIRDTVSRYVKDTVANTPAAHGISVVQIEAKTSMINDVVEYNLGNRLRESFGVIVSGVDIGAIEIDKTSTAYRELMSITKDITTATIQAQTMANIEDYQENLRIQREEGQYEHRMQTRSANIGAYQVEKQAEVGVAGAEALGKMSENGAGSVNLGGGGVGFNPAAMMASMAVGGVVANNIASTYNGAMASGTAVPPPIPKRTYHIAVNGQSSGPYEFAAICDMIAKGEVTKETLVWKTSAPSWEKACNFEELKSYFPPEIPRV